MKGSWIGDSGVFGEEECSVADGGASEERVDILIASSAAAQGTDLPQRSALFHVGKMELHWRISNPEKTGDVDELREAFQQRMRLLRRR